MKLMALALSAAMAPGAVPGALAQGGSGGPTQTPPGQSTPVAPAEPVTGRADRSDNVVAVFADWSVFVERAQGVCWAASKPLVVEGSAGPDAKPGDIVLMASYFARSPDAPAEFAFSAGSDLGEGTSAMLDVGGESYQMFAQRDFAWPLNRGDDPKLALALPQAENVTLTALYSDGSSATYVFSTAGFETALATARTNCL